MRLHDDAILSVRERRHVCREIWKSMKDTTEKFADGLWAVEISAHRHHLVFGVMKCRNHTSRIMPVLRVNVCADDRFPLACKFWRAEGHYKPPSSENHSL